MPDKNILQINESELDRRIRLITEQTLNQALDAEAEELAHAKKYERTEGRQAYRAGHYSRDFTAKVGRLHVRVPKLKGMLFESMVLDRYRRREESVDEAVRHVSCRRLAAAGG